MSPIHIIKPGTFTAANGRTHTFTDQHIAELSESYDTALFAAPIVKGHPSNDAPRLGEIVKLEARKNGLYGHVQDMDVAFSDEIKQKRYKYVSASIYLADTPNNPTPGKLYLKHVGFVPIPAVKGLDPVQFSETEDGLVELTIEFSDEPQTFDLANLSREELFALNLADLTQEQLAVALDLIKKETAALAMGHADLAAQKADLAYQRARMAAQEYAHNLSDEGRLLPNQEALVVELMCALDGNETLSFADGEETVEITKQDLFKRFISSIPIQVDFSERTQGGSVETIDLGDGKTRTVEIKKIIAEEAKKGNDITPVQASKILDKRYKKAD